LSAIDLMAALTKEAQAYIRERDVVPVDDSL
jgi:hypothetical protein